jgi:hypothetical protein
MWCPLPLTRVEFRLGRDALKHLGIDSVADLAEKESSLVDWLTRCWFRLLEKPAVRGHENDAALHPLWLEVQAAFRQWFPGMRAGNKEVKWNYKKPVSCDPVALEKQAAGCLAKAAASRFGTQKTVSDTMGLVTSLDLLHNSNLCFGVYNTAYQRCPQQMSSASVTVRMCHNLKRFYLCINVLYRYTLR